MPSVTFSDGSEHLLGKPSFKTLQLLQDNGVDMTSGELNLSSIMLPVIVTALITQAEPDFALTPLEVAELMPLNEADQYLEAVAAVFDSAFPDSKDDEPKRPTSGRAGDTKQ